MIRHFCDIRPCWRWRVMPLAGVSSVVVLCIGLVAMVTSPNNEIPDQSLSGSSRPSFPHARSPDPIWYFRSGQCSADLRTLFEAVRYVLEPENNQGGEPTCRPSGPAAISTNAPFPATAEPGISDNPPLPSQPPSL